MSYYHVAPHLADQIADQIADHAAHTEAKKGGDENNAPTSPFLLRGLMLTYHFLLFLAPSRAPSQVANPHNALCIEQRTAAKPKEAQVRVFFR